MSSKSRRRPPARSIPAPEPQSSKHHTTIVLLIALAARLGVAATLWDLPLVRTPKLDSFELLSWARRLASGDWAWPVVAQHAPGYPLFLAALLAVGGGSLKAVMVAQALLGAGTAVLVAATGRNVFGRRAGLLAGLVYALYGPAVYIDIALLSEGLLLFLLALASRTLTAGPLTPSRAAVAGAALGAATLVRPTALIVAAVLIAWMVVRRTAVSAAACAAAIVVVLSPAMARSWSASGSPAFQGYGGLNAYIGNSPNHEGRATFRLGGGWDALNSEAARAGISDPSAQDRYYLAKTWREVAARPAAFLRLLAAKAAWLLQAEEVRDSHSYYFFARQSPLLRVLPRWWLLFPAAAIGILWSAQAARESVPRLWVPAAVLAGAAASVILLVVGFRYRMPVVLALAPFAGAGLDHLVSAYQASAVRPLAIAAGAAVIALVLSLILHDPRNTNVAEEWAFTGSSLITEHRLDEADAAYRRALELDPQSGLAWDGLGLARLNANRLAEARDALERATAVDRDSSRASYHLGLVNEREGKLGRAAEDYERALALSPHDAEITAQLAGARRKLATELAMSGRLRDARDEMQRVVDLTPANGDAWLDLCLLALDLRDVDAADSALRRARERGADPAKIQFAADALARLVREKKP